MDAPTLIEIALSFFGLANGLGGPVLNEDSDPNRVSKPIG